jgi:ATP-dependent exoDNAse (exonuclease V) beta subunit
MHTVAAALAHVGAGVDGVAGGTNKTAMARVAAAREALLSLQQVIGGDTQAWDDDGDPEVAAARIVAELRATVGGNWGGSSLIEKRKALVEAVDSLATALIDEHAVVVAGAVCRLLVELERRQRREKDQRGFLGFGDLLVRTRDLLRDNRSVRARVKARFHRIFVDEYQDTSPVQEELVALLAEDPSRGARLSFARTSAGPLADVVVPHGRLFLVGDPKQSIYGFRGADAGVFTRAMRALCTPAAEGRAAVATLQRLSVSRRSSPAVCALVNVVSATTLPDHRGEDLVPLAGGASVPGEPCGAWWRAGPALTERGLPAVEAEAAVVADRIVAFLAQRGDERLPAAPRAPEDVLLLVRRGRSAPIFGRALARRGVPVRVVGGDGFWRRPEILDLVSALALVVDSGDELAALTVLRSPLCAVPDDQIIAIVEALPDGPTSLSWPGIVDAVDDELVDRAVAARVRAFDALLRALRASLPLRPLSRCIDMLLDDGGYAVACAVEPDGEVRLRHIEKLRALCDGRPEDGVLLVTRLMDAVDRPPPEAVIVDLSDSAGAVRIMTIHQSKGLESEVVVLADAGSPPRHDTDAIAFDPDVGLAVSLRGRPVADAVRTRSPTATTALQRVQRSARARDEAERPRLLYVALTRARRGVFVVGEGAPGSLLALLSAARDHDPTSFDALLPPAVVNHVGEERVRLPGVAARAPSTAEANRAANTSERSPPRLRASSLLARSDAQLSMSIPLAGEGEGLSVDDDDILPPRARGRLAHAVLALVAAERPDALDTAEDARAAVVAALHALGAPPLSRSGGPDDALLDALVRTLRGPMRVLRDEGRVFSFEEPVVLVTDVAVVEGTADLIARGPEDAVVVEWKLSAAAARGPGAIVQVQACCAALEQRGGHDELRYAVWTIGDLQPPPSQVWGRVARRELATVLARLTPSSTQP